ncbi:MAG: gamma carbonic anhydrase family protein [Planctomycetota bacterium]|nr:MAG: gamma carbonic anhydrase family protein [Planctomycetota bacterium]
MPGGAMVAYNAIVTGEVDLGEDVNVWFQAVVRGDEAPISIGPRTNVQDGVIVHTDSGLPCRIGADCTLGHGAVIHGLEVGDGCLIGIKAVILGRAKIGAGSVVAAGAVVKEGAEIPPGVLVAGVPARIIREVGEKERQFMAHSIPVYLGLADRYLPEEERRQEA